jgi:acetyl-CoA C-acetyltransferase
LNVKGSSLAAAHPFAATGGRIIATLAKLLNQKGSGRGFISICAARGQGITMILEKPTPNTSQSMPIVCEELGLE